MNPDMIPAERHLLDPFLPRGAKMLMLGSFPPKRERWSMDFFYPNFNNDMWRILGIVFFGDREHFTVSGERRFDKEMAMRFCNDKGIALFDTATEVRRLKDNASDKFLEIVQATDIDGLLAEIPECRAIAVTGQKAAETLSEFLGCPVPATGEMIETARDKVLRLYRLPSSSRAYPLPIEKKAAAYRQMFLSEGLL